MMFVISVGHIEDHTCMCDKHKVSVDVCVYSVKAMWANRIYTHQQNDEKWTTVDSHNIFVYSM